MQPLLQKPGQRGVQRSGGQCQRTRTCAELNPDAHAALLGALTELVRLGPGHPQPGRAPRYPPVFSDVARLLPADVVVPTPEDHLCWLRDTGFAEVDCVWKQFSEVFLCGFRSP